MRWDGRAAPGPEGGAASGLRRATFRGTGSFVEGLNPSWRDLIVQTNDRHTQERDGVIGAQNPFLVLVDVKNFVQRREVPDVEVIGPRGCQAIKT